MANVSVIGGSAAPELEYLYVDSNGTYTPNPGFDGFASVVVALPLGNKSVTQNGTYFAMDDNLEGYKKFVVDVPEPVLVGKIITQHGTYYAQDDDANGYRVVEVNVAGGKPLADYMQFTDTRNNYVDIGALVNASHNIKIYFDVDTYKHFNTMLGNSSGMNELYIVQYNNEYYVYDGQTEIHFAASLTGKHSIEFGANGILFDDVYKAPYTLHTSNIHLWFNWRYGYPAYDNNAYNGKINKVEVTDISTGNLINELIPCVYPNSSGVYVTGFYDRVNDTYIDGNNYSVGNYLT